MKRIIEQSDKICLRLTEEDDLEFVLWAESHPDNSKYVFQWTRQKHLDAMADGDIFHLIVENRKDSRPVGYIILAGLKNPNKSIEFRRIVITDKGKGFGREALRLIKKLSFNRFKAHRLWLDVKDHNVNAQNLYISEGFVKEGILRECLENNDGYESLIVMSMLEHEFYDDEI